MLAHGTDPANLDEETFTDISIMYADGMIGNRGILEVLGTLTAGQFNKMLPKGASPYTLEKIIPRAHDYLYPPLDEKTKKERVSQSLLAFAMMSPNAPTQFFKGK